MQRVPKKCIKLLKPFQAPNPLNYADNDITFVFHMTSLELPHQLHHACINTTPCAKQESQPDKNQIKQIHSQEILPSIMKDG